MVRMEISWFSALTLVLVLAFNLALAQTRTDDDSSATADGAGATAPIQDADDQADPESESDEDASAGQEALPEDDEQKVPDAILDAIDNQDKVHATMDRFVPTEQLSEDRAVSFPNDI